jgi:IS4 transposase
MAREKKRKGKSRKGTPQRGERSDRDIEVKLAPTVNFLHEHITESLCEEVFRDVRMHERQRKWTLFALARFWLAVILKPPPSLSQVLERTRRLDPKGLLPHVAASAESFFQKCKVFSSSFFMALYHHFVERILPDAPAAYCQEVAYLRERFSEVLVIDGSRLDKIAHRLKLFWSEEAAILPGCLTAVYDLFRGIATQLWFDPDAAKAEHKRGLQAVEGLPEGTLLLGDRLYCSIQIFLALVENACFGLFRRNKTVSITKVRLLSKEKVRDQAVEDWLVRAGTGKKAVDLRLIVLKKNRSTYEAMTNVLDPKRLSALDVIALYPLRWTVERLFYDLKVVLNLKRFYAANPNAIAMQVYAAAMVHAAFRVAQADVARGADLPPDELSPKKLFPLLALVSITLIEARFRFKQTCDANPGVELREPSWDDDADTVVSLRSIRVQRRSSARRKRGFSPERRKWKSITNIDGTEELT